MSGGGNGYNSEATPDDLERAGYFSRSMYGAAIPAAGTEQSDMLAAQTGDFGMYGLGKTMEAASGAEGLSPTQRNASKYAGKLLSAAGGDEGKAAAFLIGAGLLGRGNRGPDVKMPAPSAPRGESNTPLPLAYQSSPLQVSGVASHLPPPGVTWAEWMRRKQMNGL